MKLSAVLLSASAIFLFAGSAIAADVAPAAPAMPESGTFALKNGAHPLSIGPKDSGRARVARGKLNLIGFAPREANPASVEIFVDNKSVGTADKRPFAVEFDSSTIPDGEHVVKAVGKDSTGKEVWAASATINVANSSSTESMPSAPPAVSPTVPNEASSASPAAPKPGQIRPSAPQRTASPTMSASLDKTYSSVKYGFSIKYPGTWKLNDETAKMTPKSKGGFWIVLDGTSAAQNGKMVVNIRRAALQPGTDANIFAKFNTYVQKWEQKSIQGSPAFTTTAGTPEAKRVVHRAIIIRDGYSWMLNCIDSSGKPTAQSAKLFDDMINTLQSTK